MKPLAFALLGAAFAVLPTVAVAQGTPAPAAPAAAAPGTKLVLVPYELPGSTDPHAPAITKEIADRFAGSAIAVTPIAPVDHLDAIANAAKLCSDNNATGLLVPAGRYEQTTKTFQISFVTIVKYPTHVELRLDEVGCDGAIRWSTTSVGDETPSGAYSVGNVGAAVDAAFRTAVTTAVGARAAATVAQTTAGAAAPAAAAVSASATPPSTYALLPVEEPGIADPRAPDMTGSLVKQLQQHKIDVKLVAPVDHAAAVSQAARICATAGAQGIIVPDVRIEQSGFTGRSYAALQLTTLTCSGAVVGHGSGTADMKGNLFAHNVGAQLVGVTERAMTPAIEQLFPNAPKAAASAG